MVGIDVIVFIILQLYTCLIHWRGEGWGGKHQGVGVGRGIKREGWEGVRMEASRGRSEEGSTKGEGSGGKHQGGWVGRGEDGSIKGEE